MTPEELRDLYVETLARAAWENRAPARSSDPAWEQLSGPRRELFQEWGARYADALAAAGLLPTGENYRQAYEPDGAPLGYRERLLFTDWREVPAPCAGCGVTERQCAAVRASRPLTAHWANSDEVARQRREAGCCPDCRHPLREVQP